MKKYEIPFSGGSPGPLVGEVCGLRGADAEELFRQGSVWWENRRLRDPGEVLPPGMLKVFQPEKPIIPFILDPQAVVFEDEDLLVVFKPPNLNTVQTAMSDMDNLTRGVQRYLEPTWSAGSGRYQVNAVHRLDMPAQGLVHFGKHKEAEKRLFSLFQNRQIRKMYLAWIPSLSGSRTGDVLFLRDTLEWMGKEKRACSWLKCLYRETDRELWAASPLTGRPHQLRKHFARYLKPIIGDVMYGGWEIPAQLKLASVYSRFRHPFSGRLLECLRIPSGWDCFEAAPPPGGLRP